MEKAKKKPKTFMEVLTGSTKEENKQWRIEEKKKEEELKKNLPLVRKGDRVYADGMGGFIHPEWKVVTNVTTQYNQKTGKPYKVIHCGSHQFDSRNGAALTPPMAYYISEIKKKK